VEEETNEHAEIIYVVSAQLQRWRQQRAFYRQIWQKSRQQPEILQLLQPLL
jgi:hypothetical protein